MSDDLRVRTAEASDVELLADLGRRTFVGAFGAENDPSQVADYLEEAFRPEQVRVEMGEPSSLFLIAEREGEPVGYAKLRKSTPPDCVKDRTAFELERIYADQHVIGRGVGSALMKACLEEIRTRDGRSVWLGVWERNHHAIRFYMKWGFEEVGTKAFALGEEIQTDVVMVRDVRSP